MDGDSELLEELPEPKRPPYRCGAFISKQLKAEKVIDSFNAGRTSLESLLKYLQEHKDFHDDIPSLLEAYKNIEQEYVESRHVEKKFPLIVLEGLDGSGKSAVGIRLAKKCNADRIQTPPRSMSMFREKFQDHYWFHAPFFYLGNYVAAIEVLRILKDRPVIMDRFWHSTTAFQLAQLKEDYFEVMKSTEVPKKGSDVYLWPQDLLKPDAVILLDVSEDVRTQRLSRRTTETEQEKLLSSKKEFRKNILLAYENMENPAVQKVNGDGGFNSVLHEIDEKIKHLF